MDAIRMGEEPSENRARLAVVFSGTAHALTSVTRHAIDNNQILDGEHLSPSELLELAVAVLNGRNQAVSAEIIPSNVLTYNAQWMIWYQPSRVAPYWFSGSGNERQHVMIKWPAMLFEINRANRKFRCVALDSDDRPVASSKVYDLPIPNAYHGGGFCLGTASLPLKLELSSMAEIESCVYDAIKTHSSNNKAIKTGENPTAYWVNKSKRGRRPSIPKKDMTAIGTLGNWIGKAGL